MAKIEGFRPTFLTNANSRSYRSFYKWGDQNRYYTLSSRSRLYDYVRDSLSLTDDFFKEPNYANDSVQVAKISTGLDNKDVDHFRNIVGDENVLVDLDARIKASITKNNEELTKMHEGILPPIVDAVICPSSDKEIIDILAYCKKKKIAYNVRSSLIPKIVDKKTIVIDLTHRFNKIVEFNEVDSYVRVETGMYLPILENILSNAPDNFKDYNIANKFTLGHFPRVYEECTIYDALTKFIYGQESGYYGDFNDITMELEYATENGTTNEWVEGAIPTYAKLKITKSYPHNKYGFSYMFRSYQEAINALREIYSRNSATPVHIMLADAKETSLLMHYYMLDDTPVDGWLNMWKCKDGERCLMIGFSGGAYTYSRIAFNLVRNIAKKYKAKSLTSFVADAYEDSRYNEMYVREAVSDFGISVTSEVYNISYSELPDKHKDIASSIESGITRSRIISANKNGVILEVIKVKV